MIRRNPLQRGELKAAEALNRAGISISVPGEGEPTNPLSQQWGVFHGSHGGYGRRLKTAMERSLKCCGLGAWWRNEYGKGELTRVFMQRVARRYLGASLKLPLWKKGA